MVVVDVVVSLVIVVVVVVIEVSLVKVVVVHQYIYTLFDEAIENLLRARYKAMIIKRSSCPFLVVVDILNSEILLLFPASDNVKV